ncbi:unnamed protein product [Effrenium voratum]|nr:unnamed protein product [Effrenium voratum]
MFWGARSPPGNPLLGRLPGTVAKAVAGLTERLELLEGRSTEARFGGGGSFFALPTPTNSSSTTRERPLTLERPERRSAPSPRRWLQVPGHLAGECGTVVETAQEAVTPRYADVQWAMACQVDAPPDFSAETATQQTQIDSVARALVRSVSLAALGAWLAAERSDVEKALRRAMRDRHRELCQATRAQIAKRVLGVAVLRKRLAHLLQRAQLPESAELLLALFERRELKVASELDLRGAAEAPLFEEHERPSAAVRLSVAWSLPTWVAEEWVRQFGALVAFDPELPQLGLCAAHWFKTSRAELMAVLAKRGVRSCPTAQSVWQLPGYKEGLFEVQDEGSQLVALARAGERVVDYCAGRGGKTWVLAQLVAPDGLVRAWDVEDFLRQQLVGARQSRAQAQGLVEVLHAKPQELADVVLVDAPCSSSGVLRRHPSQRWALDGSIDLPELQLEILSEASRLVHKGGRLVYATCSLLGEENQVRGWGWMLGWGSVVLESWAEEGRKA